MSKTALVFGASGVSGWSFINELLHDYPKKGIWESVIAVTKRPLRQAESLWPIDDRLQLVSGVNLLDAQDDVESALKAKVSNIDRVTHVYYLAYKASTDIQQELEDAVNMFQCSITAVDRLSSVLEFVVLQTGAKMYGCHLTVNHPTTYIHVPLAEDQPRLQQPYHDLLFYHPQLDWLTDFAKDKTWNWCDTRPDIIIGFVPNQNFYSLAQSIGIFLALYAAIEGQGAEVPFPGTVESWLAKSHDSSSDMIARQTIHLSLYMPQSQKGEGFNVADAKECSTWEQKWPQITSYFGLKSTAPSSSHDNKATLEVRKYINDHLDTWRQLEDKYDLNTGVANSELTYPGFEQFLLSQFDFDRQYDMSKMYSTPPDRPFEEERTTKEAWCGVFDRMRDAKLIPHG